MNPEGRYSVGCRLELGRCDLLLRSLGGQVLQKVSVAIPEVLSGDLTQLVGRQIESLLAQQPDSVRSRVVGVGVAASPEYEYSPSGVWSMQQARDELQRLTGQAVFAYASGAAGAWAELAAIPPPRPSDYLYLHLDRQLHSGFVLNGRLWQGPYGQSGSLAKAFPLIGEVEAGRARPDSTQLGAAIRQVCISLGIPLVVVDGDWHGADLDKLVAELTEVVAVDGQTSPAVARGRAGSEAILRGAALRPLYVRLFSKPGD
jgi:hypothetical protein